MKPPDNDPSSPPPSETSAEPEPEHPSSGSADNSVGFPSTLWDVVLDAAKGEEAQSEAALTTLTEIYSPAIRRYFTRCCRDPLHAEDLASSFIERLLEKNRFRQFERRANNEFRKYLSRMMKNFYLDHLPKPPALESFSPETAGAVTCDPGVEFDRDVARAIGARALASLSAAADRKEEKRVRLTRLQGFLRREAEDGDYQSAAKDLGLSLLAIRQAVFRMREDFYDCFRTEVDKTVRRASGELEAETRHLMGLFLNDGECDGSARA